MADTGGAATTGSLLRPTLMVASGNFLEMYDFMVFGYYAQAIAKAYFPSADPFLALMASFSVFGVGFAMRPIGALVLGTVIDRFGRRHGLLITLGLMAVGTLTIALTPPFARIGLAAPLVVVFGRVVQGLSAGVEIGGVSVYLAEIANDRNRGFVVAWQSASQQPAVIVAGALGVGLAAWLNPAQLQDWGWRLPFIAGCLLIPFLLLMRGRLKETPQFLERAERLTTPQILGRIGRNAGVIVLGAMMVTMTTVTFYFSTAYTPTFGVAVLHLSSFSAFLVTACVGLSNFILLPLSGALSDRIGRLPILFVVAGLGLVGGYPVLRWLVGSPSFSHLLIVELWFSVLFAVYNGAMVAHLTEVMPLAVRTAGFSLAYSLASGVFGGFTPLVATWLIHHTGDKASPGWWLSAAAAMGLVGVAGLRALHAAPASQSQH